MANNTGNYLDAFLNSPTVKKEVKPFVEEVRCYNREELTCCTWSERTERLNFNADFLGFKGSDRKNYFKTWND